ncbi:hypothetical protein K438DRAFT_1773061 [Mycena galopus ATCC 62051]|nr:hypothetical protein K438DRAFT_1773061 [Mycena galopus ATCC 62051]
MAASEMVMDRRGGRDPRYWCLPHSVVIRQECGASRKRDLNFTWCGRATQWARSTHVGNADNAEQGSGQDELDWLSRQCNKGFHTLDECIEAWQTMCPLPQRAPSPDPPSPQQQPRCVDPPTPRMRNEGKRKSAVKQEAETSPGSLGSSSSSPSGSDLALLQRQGEEPDMLVTRSFARASIFALDTEGETEDDDVPD